MWVVLATYLLKWSSEVAAKIWQNHFHCFEARSTKENGVTFVSIRVSGRALIWRECENEDTYKKSFFSHQYQLLLGHVRVCLDRSNLGISTKVKAGKNASTPWRFRWRAVIKSCLRLIPVIQIIKERPSEGCWPSQRLLQGTVNSQSSHSLLPGLQWQTQRHRPSVLSVAADNQSVTQSPHPMPQIWEKHSVKPERIKGKMKGVQRSLW